MKRLFAVFALTPAEQRVVIFAVLLLVAFAWLKQQRDLKFESTGAKPHFSLARRPMISPQGAAI